MPRKKVRRGWKAPPERSYARLTRHKRQTNKRMLDRTRSCRGIARGVRARAVGGGRRDCAAPVRHRVEVARGRADAGEPLGRVRAPAALAEMPQRVPRAKLAWHVPDGRIVPRGQPNGEPRTRRAESGNDARRGGAAWASDPSQRLETNPTPAGTRKRMPFRGLLPISLRARTGQPLGAFRSGWK